MGRPKKEDTEVNMDKIKEVISCLLDAKLAPITADLKAVSEAVSRLEQRSETDRVRTQQIEQKVATLEISLQDTRGEIKKLKDYITDMDNYNRRDCLNIWGITENAGENCADIARALFEDMDVARWEHIKFTRIHRVGIAKKGMSRAIRVKFHFYPDLEGVYASRGCLRGTGKAVAKVYAPETETRRRIMNPISQAAYKHKNSLPPEEKNAYRLRYINDKLTLNGKTFTPDNLHELPHYLAPEYLATKSTSSHIFFWGPGSPLSNHHPAKFILDNQKYTSAEQCIMHKKALMFNDLEAASKILEEESPVAQRNLGRDVKLFDRQTWMASSRDTVRAALHAKFSQNEHLKTKLLETGVLIPVEASPRDQYWGIGMGLHDPQITDPHKWKGKNVLGQLLAEVRENINA